VTGLVIYFSIAIVIMRGVMLLVRVGSSGIAEVNAFG
jgi:hypothetical protein